MAALGDKLAYGLTNIAASPVRGLAWLGGKMGIQPLQNVYDSLKPVNFGPTQISIPSPTNQAQKTPTTTNNKNPLTQPTGSGGGGGAIGAGGSFLTPELLGYDNVFDPNTFNFDAMFQPAFDAIKQREGAAQSSYNAALGELDAGATEAKSLIEKNRAEQQASLDASKTDTLQREESGVSELARTRGELDQSNISRFGTGSSAGQAATDILNSSFLRNVGEVRQQTTDALNQIAGEGRRLTEFTTAQIQNVDKQTMAAKQSARADLENILAQLATATGELAANKSQMVYGALRDYKDKLLSIDQINLQIKNTVAQFNANMKAQLASAANSVQDKSMDLFKTLAAQGISLRDAAQLSGLAQTDQELAKFPVSAQPDAYQKVQNLLGATSLFNPTTGQQFSSSIFDPTPQASSSGGGLGGLLNSLLGR